MDPASTTQREAQAAAAHLPAALMLRAVVYCLPLTEPCVIHIKPAAAASHRSQKRAWNVVPGTHLLLEKTPHIPDCTVGKSESDTNVRRVKSCPCV